MPQVLNEQVVDEITAMNAKGLSDMMQTAMGLSVQNAVANQNTTQTAAAAALANGLTIGQAVMQNGINLAQAINARAVRFAFDISAEQAAAFDRQLSADVSGRLMNIEAALSGGQQASKIAQSTAPQTGTGGAFGSDAGSAINQQIANLSATVAALQAQLNAVRGGGGT